MRIRICPHCGKLNYSSAVKKEEWECYNCGAVIPRSCTVTTQITELQSRIQTKLKALREIIRMEDIESPTVPEYKEHHESIQRILKEIDKLLKDFREEGR